MIAQITMTTITPRTIQAVVDICGSWERETAGGSLA